MEPRLPLSWWDAMQQPETYPHAVQCPIQVLQTHISTIFLTGEYAYKVKKPVDLGFLNFSTLARRHHYCQEEIRLNRAIAPEIYLEAVAIARQGNRFRVGGEGEAIEYAVKMRQFPQEGLFSELLARDEVTVELMAELGKTVAQFHARTPSNDYIRSFGSVKTIRQAIESNYDHTRAYIDRWHLSAPFAATRHFTESFFAEKRSLFEQRQECDKIRECHGDLHLKNICWWRDKIQLFDRIEFNEEFRFVDTFYDVAFTVMDVEARDRPDLGNAFLNSYLDYSGDWEGVQVLPLYLCRQAYVRAKVNSLTSDDERISAADRNAAATAAIDYYRLAWKYTQPRSGRLLLMSGLSGSGKTTVGRYLARKLNAIHLRSDAIRKHLAGISVETKGSSAVYSAELSEQTYDRLLSAGLTLARQGFTVILDAKYDRRSRRLEALSRAQKHQLPVEIYRCTAPAEVLRDRLARRQGDISDATPDLVDRQLASSEPFGEDEKSCVRIIETTGDWQRQLSFELAGTISRC